jgi:pSer/pThr/pTyr-binding forkhead associated (FHA) protein
MKCTACGAENAADARFCSQCGAPLADAEATTTLPRMDDSGELSPVAAAAVEGLAPGNALLVVQRGPGAGSRFLLDSDLVHVGRHPDSDIFLDDVTVSRRHAEFTRTGDSFAVSDTGSLNGTYVNRDRIDSVLLKDGDEVQIGKFRLVFYAGHEDV